VKNRWYSHLKYETWREGEKYILAVGQDSPFPDRKKRNRPKVCPKQNALRYLEQQRGLVLIPKVIPPIVPKPPDDPPQPEVEDFWNRMIADEDPDEHLSLFQLF
jgi:hypothetical protein